MWSVLRLIGGLVGFLHLTTVTMVTMCFWLVILASWALCLIIEMNKIKDFAAGKGSFTYYVIS